MSSNRTLPSPRVAFRGLAALGLCAMLAACAARAPASDPHVARTPVTPTQRFANVVTQTPDEILLAPHATGLSPAQSAALAQLVERWREAGAGPITISPPAAGGGEAYRMAAAVQAGLTGLGVDERQIRLAAEETGATGGPVAVSFARYSAEGPACGREWTSFTHSEDNQPNSNFGCATTANLAAMVANPADLAAPRTSDPADASRREVVIGKYRSGSVTSTATDSQANGHVSTAVN